MSAKVRFADLNPAALGVKLKLTLHAAPALSDEQVFAVTLKSPALAPANETLENVAVAPPVFVTVRFPAPLVSPAGCEPNVQLGFENATVEGAVELPADPVPPTGTDCGLPEALSVNVRLAVLNPVPVGLKLKLTLQVAFAPSDKQLFAVILKSAGLAPVNETFENVTVDVPPLVTDIFPAPLASPIGWEPNVQLAFENVRVDPGVGLPGDPVPCTGIDWGLPEAVSVKVRFACRTPLAVGMKLKVTVQAAAGASDEQPFETILKSAGLAPVNATFENVAAELPLFVTTIRPFPLASPTGWAPKVQLAFEKLSVDAGGGGLPPSNP